MTILDFVGINWGSSKFRAYRISEDELVVDQFESSAGVAHLSREEMVDTANLVVDRWPDVRLAYASGMIGSNVGWLDAAYCDLPTSTMLLASALSETKIGNLECRIVPGLASQCPEFGPDVMRGEEIELLGLLRNDPDLSDGAHIVAMPGTHTKWVAIENGNIVRFFTSMSGEIFDRLQQAGLLSSILEGNGISGEAFIRAVRDIENSPAGVSRMLFGVRAEFVLNDLTKLNAASRARGALIGAEILDAVERFPILNQSKPVKLLGNPSLCKLYADALEVFGIHSEICDGPKATIAGFASLHHSAYSASKLTL